MKQKNGVTKTLKNIEKIVCESSVMKRTIPDIFNKENDEEVSMNNLMPIVMLNFIQYVKLILTIFS